MGKSYSKWFARLIRRKKRSYTNDGADAGDGGIAMDPNKHAIAVAAATAAVAEAALAAAKAAAEVVRLTSRSGSAVSGNGEFGGMRWSVEDYSAAVRIQSAFRGYLARRALRALKGLVKLQALVRGHFVRKRSGDMVRRMQAMVRVQARARANRMHNLETTYFGPETHRKHSLQHQASIKKLNGSYILKRCGSVSSARDAKERASPCPSWLDCRTEDCSRTSSHNSLSRLAKMDDENTDKILEIDSWRPHLTPNIARNYPSSKVSAMDYYYDTQRYHRHHSFAASETHTKYSMSLNHPSRSPCNTESVVSARSFNIPPMEQEFSPHACSVPSRPGSSHSKGRTVSPFTPTRNDCSRSCYGGSGHMGTYYPSYMANTESSRAKVRSHSAPRQRMEWFESYGTSKRLSAYRNDLSVSRSYSRRNPDP